MASRVNTVKSLQAFEKWLGKNPIVGDRVYSGFGIRYQVARYCEYLHSNSPPNGDPLKDVEARDSAVLAYRNYLKMFKTPPDSINLILISLDHFYTFLGLGPATVARESTDDAP